MIYCSIHIDYYAQLERVRSDYALGLIASLRRICGEFGALSGQRDNPLVASFADSGPFSLFLAAEALARLQRALDEASPALHGALVTVHRCLNQEEALNRCSLIRLNSDASFGAAFSPEARETLNAYFPFPDDMREISWLYPYHQSSFEDASATALLRRESSPDPAWRFLDSIAHSTLRLTVLERYRPTRSLDLFADALCDARTGSTVLRLRANFSHSRAFDPFIEALTPELLNSLEDDRNKDSIDSSAAFTLLRASPFADYSAPALARGCALFIHGVLDRIGASGAILVCDSPDRFSPEAQALIAERLRQNRGSERYVVLSPGSVPESWKIPGTLALDVHAPAMEALDGAMAQALGHSTGAARDSIRQRYLALCGKRKAIDRHAENSYELLQLLPREGALYLYGALIAESILDSGSLALFFERMGLQPEGARMLRSLLINCGFLDPLSESRPLRPLAAAALSQATGKAGSDYIDGQFAAYLERLYADGKIKPSLGLLSRVGERKENEGLLYDCLFSDALSPGGGAQQALERLSADSAAVYALWRSLRDGEREACERSAAQLDTIAGSRATLLRGLAKAELAYASGDAERASKGSREALLAVAKGTPSKLEARAHRMMGLAALAEGKYAEAADYLNNAQELSENAGDSYERFMAAYARTIGEFMTGALVRALSIAEQARASAMRLFRIEGLAAIDLLLGRIRFELGDYDEAARLYEALAALAQEYGLYDAAVRAAIWRGRALAYAGDFEEAERSLGSFGEDAEARVFLGELWILRGEPQEALPWLERASEQRPRPYHPADAIQWTSCYAEIEDRCISFSATDHALEELRKALKLYAQGLATKNPDYATELYALTRNEASSKASPGAGTYSLFCYLLEEELPEPPVDKQTVLSRAFKALQQRAGRIEERSKRALYMEKNHWNKRLMQAAREHKFI
ncbi:MAG TPA: hypothetical protein DCG47_10580 [Spirochaetaceae bacterium]|nr:hypothetical protein [Spirochaetaceae bacterium]